MHSWKSVFYGGDGNQAARYCRITLRVYLHHLDNSSSLQFTRVMRQFIHALMYYWFSHSQPPVIQYRSLTALSTYVHMLLMSSLRFKYAIAGFTYNSEPIISISSVQSLTEFHVSCKVFVCVWLMCRLAVAVCFIVTDAFMVFISDQTKRRKEKIISITSFTSKALLQPLN